MENRLVWGSMLPKICIASKIALNKSSSKLNFVLKNQQAHMSISPRNGARRLERFPSLKNNTVQKLESRDTLGLDTAKNMHYMRKCFKWKLLSIEFCTKVSGHTSVSSPSQILARGLCTEFNAQQLLLETFPDIIHIFGSVEPQTESSCLFQ